MANKKKQHYVPKSYLRRFSDGASNTINLFNVDREESITNVAIRNQCYEPYYYGADLQLENAFEKLETRAAHIINKVLSESKLPQKVSDEYLVLLFYILTQANRTKRTGEEHDEITNKFAAIMFQGDEELRNALQHWKIVSRIPTATPLAIVAEKWVLAFDLNMKIILNLSLEEFITSDNPVVFYNQYMENMKGLSCTGLLSHGLQIFLPISPQAVLHLYDPTVYKVGSDRYDWCYVYDGQEVTKLNELQWLSALENVFYSSSTSIESIRTQAKRFLPRRPKELAVVEEFQHNQDECSSLVILKKRDLKTRLRPSFVRIMRSKKIIPLNKRKPVRDEEMLKLWNQFKEEVAAGRYRRQDFIKFLAGH